MLGQASRATVSPHSHRSKLSFNRHGSDTELRHHQKTVSVSSTHISLNVNLLDSEKSIESVLAKREAGEPFTMKDAKFLWHKRLILRQKYPSALPALVDAVSKHLKGAFRELYMLLRGWNTSSISDALELMGCDDSFIRAYAVQEFDFLASENTVTNYMLQLTQALKAEPFHDSTLARFLLRRAIANPARVGHCLYWSLAADAHIKGSAHRFELLKNTFLRHCGSYRTALGHQNFILQKLKQIQDKVKCMKETHNYTKKDELRKCVKEMNSVFPEVYRLPLRAAMKMGNINPKKCRVMSSKMAPLWLCFDTVRPAGQIYQVLFKCGKYLKK